MEVLAIPHSSANTITEKTEEADSSVSGEKLLPHPRRKSKMLAIILGFVWKEKEKSEYSLS